MSSALLARLLEVIIEHRLYIQRRMTSCHRQDTNSFLDNDQPLVFIHNLHVTALKTLLIALGLTYGDLHAFLQRKVELTHRLAIYLDTPTLERRLNLRLALLNIGKKPFQQRHRFRDYEMVVFSLTVISCVISHS